MMAYVTAVGSLIGYIYIGIHVTESIRLEPDIVKYAHAASKIVPNNDARRNAYPFTVSLLDEERYTMACTGTIIHRLWVLTAAQCIKKHATIVIAGLYDWSTDWADPNSDIQVRFFVRQYIHPMYNMSAGYDIALGRMNFGLNLTGDAVSTISMLSSASFLTKVLANKRQCRLLGWGRTDTAGVEWLFTERLSQQDITFVDDAAAKARGYKVAKGNYNFEAIYKDKCKQESACEGDEGGPLVCKKGGQWVQVGFYVFGSPYDGCMGGLKSAVNILHYIEWINSYNS